MTDQTRDREDRNEEVGVPTPDRSRGQANTSGHSQPVDAGRTSGGGSLGHDQPADVQRETPIRNATGREDDPVMPADDATLNTKI